MKKQIVVALVAALSVAASTATMAGQFTFNQGLSKDNVYVGGSVGAGHAFKNKFGFDLNTGYNFASFNSVKLAADLGYMNVGSSNYAITFAGKGTYDIQNTPMDVFAKLGIAAVHHGDDNDSTTTNNDHNNGAALYMGAGVGYKIAKVEGLEATAGFDAAVGKSPSIWLASVGLNYQF